MSSPATVPPFPRRCRGNRTMRRCHPRRRIRTRSPPGSRQVRGCCRTRYRSDSSPCCRSHRRHRGSWVQRCVGDIQRRCSWWRSADRASATWRWRPDTRVWLAAVERWMVTTVTTADYSTTPVLQVETLTPHCRHHSSGPSPLRSAATVNNCFRWVRWRRAVPRWSWLGAVGSLRDVGSPSSYRLMTLSAVLRCWCPVSHPRARFRCWAATHSWKSWQARSWRLAAAARLPSESADIWHDDSWTTPAVTSHTPYTTLW